MSNSEKKATANAHKIAARICNREDNIYKQEIIKDILRMYADEIFKCMLEGERVQISKVGTIIPEVKTHVGSYNMPSCNNFDGNPPPYTRIRISRNRLLREKMNETLLKNIKNNILGLLKLPFSKQQMVVLRNSGYIDSDEEIDYIEE